MCLCAKESRKVRRALKDIPHALRGTRLANPRVSAHWTPPKKLWLRHTVTILPNFLRPDRRVHSKFHIMAPYDSDSSDDGEEYTETNVLLGYATEDATGDAVSHLGGAPVRPALSRLSFSTLTMDHSHGWTTRRRPPARRPNAKSATAF